MTSLTRCWAKSENVIKMRFGKSLRHRNRNKER